jgi:hypothetical protein
MLDHTFLPAKNGHIESNADAKSTDVLENSKGIIFLLILIMQIGHILKKEKHI